MDRNHQENQKELTKNEILKGLGMDAMNSSSFRMNAAECGILQEARIEWVHGRKTGFYPPNSIERMRKLIERKKGARASWKMQR